MGALRLLLALSVVAGHCGTFWGWRLVDEKIAVQAFYIISGFYMSFILNEKYTGRNSSYKLFITNRLLRLYPIYWAVLLVTVGACVGIAVVSKGQSLPKFDSYLMVEPNLLSFFYLAFTNLFIFGQDIVMFLGIKPEDGSLFFTPDFWNTNPPLHSFLFISQAWTLGVELTFYLLAPFLLRRGGKVVGVVIALSFLLRMYLYYSLGLRHDPWSYRFFFTEILFFLLGYLSYRLYRVVREKEINPYVSGAALTLIFSFTALYSFWPSANAGGFPFSGKEVAYFAAVTFAIPLLFNALKKSRLDAQIGELSYPVYVSHLLVAAVCGALPFVFLQSGGVIAVLTLVFSFLLNKYIAAPLEKYRQARVLGSEKTKKELVVQ